MKYLLLVLTTLLLLGCPEATHSSSGPVALNRGSGVEAVTSTTVLYIPIRKTVQYERTTYGYLVQQTLVKWLKENPDATIKHMVVVGFSGGPKEIVLIVEGELAKPPEACKACSSDCQKCGRNLRRR